MKPSNECLNSVDLETDPIVGRVYQFELLDYCLIMDIYKRKCVVLWDDGRASTCTLGFLEAYGSRVL